MIEFHAEQRKFSDAMDVKKENEWCNGYGGWICKKEKSKKKFVKESNYSLRWEGQQKELEFNWGGAGIRDQLSLRSLLDF